MTCPVCGYEATQKEGGKTRSVEQIRRYFKMIRLAWDTWPESHEHQFASSEEMRAWLQMKAGAREIGAQIPLTGMSKERAMLFAEAAIRGAGSFAWPVIHGDTLVIFRPKSIAFSRMAHADFCRLSDDVQSVIEAETDIRVEDMMRAVA